LFGLISFGILGKLPEGGRGSILRKGHGDSVISEEVTNHIGFEENNGKAFSHYEAKDKNPQGQKTNKRGINQAKYSPAKSVIQ